jgi:HlyD family secretion protein
MASPNPWRTRRRLWLGIPMALVIAAAAWPGERPGRNGRAQGSGEDLEWIEVRRADLDTSVVAGGDLQATSEAVVTCQVEDITDSDGTLILTMVENGQTVKKGDELCRLDSSELESLAREEEILLNQARSARVQAQLTLETAQIALREFQEGLVTQQTKEFEGRIALGQSDTRRLADRVSWTERMVAKGYASRAQLLSERQALHKARHELQTAEGEFHLFRRFQVEKEIVSLKGQIGIAEHNLRLETARLKAEEEELAFIRKQIDRCIIRATQDGVAICARRPFQWRKYVEPGIRVYQNQPLFKLPDLSRMDVEVSLHESMGPRVNPGMSAAVKIASLGERVLHGHVATIATLSQVNWKEEDERIRHFIVRVRLDETPPKLLPWMSAEVEIDTGRVSGSLVIPVAAMSVVNNQKTCYVLGPDGLERRSITTRHSTRDWLEVIAGLKEGERVVTRPIRSEVAADQLTELQMPDARNWPRPA